MTIIILASFVSLSLASTNEYTFTHPTSTNLIGKGIGKDGICRIMRYEDIAFLTEAYAERNAALYPTNEFGHPLNSYLYGQTTTSVVTTKFKLLDYGFLSSSSFFFPHSFTNLTQITPGSTKYPYSCGFVSDGYAFSSGVAVCTNQLSAGQDSVSPGASLWVWNGRNVYGTLEPFVLAESKPVPPENIHTNIAGGISPSFSGDHAATFPPLLATITNAYANLKLMNTVLVPVDRSDLDWSRMTNVVEIISTTDSRPVVANYTTVTNNYGVFTYPSSWSVPEDYEIRTNHSYNALGNYITIQTGGQRTWERRLAVKTDDFPGPYAIIVGTPLKTYENRYSWLPTFDYDDAVKFTCNVLPDQDDLIEGEVDAYLVSYWTFSGSDLKREMKYSSVIDTTTNLTNQYFVCCLKATASRTEERKNGLAVWELSLGLGTVAMYMCQEKRDLITFELEDYTPDTSDVPSPLPHTTPLTSMVISAISQKNRSMRCSNYFIALVFKRKFKARVLDGE